MIDNQKLYEYEADGPSEAKITLDQNALPLSQSFFVFVFRSDQTCNSSNKKICKVS